MIRQAISCDICGAEKKQTNHWFVASEQAGELRVSGWNSRVRLRAVTKHLCGQTCLHKLMDEFMARTIAGRIPAPPAEAATPLETRPLETRSATDASLTSKLVCVESSPTAIPKATPTPCLVAAPAILAIKIPVDETRALPTVARVDDTPNYASRRWRAEAWERERALHTVERRNESGVRHRKTL